MEVGVGKGEAGCKGVPGSYSVCLPPKAGLTLKPSEVLQDYLQPNCGKPQGWGFCPQLGQPVPVLKRSCWKEPSLYAKLGHQLFQLVISINYSSTVRCCKECISRTSFFAVHVGISIFSFSGWQNQVPLSSFQHQMVQTAMPPQTPSICSPFCFSDASFLNWRGGKTITWKNY